MPPPSPSADVKAGEEAAWGVEAKSEHIKLAFSALKSQLEKRGNARADFGRAVKLVPSDDAEARRNQSYPLIMALYGMFLERTGCAEEAVDAYERAIAIEPLHSLAHGNLPGLLESRDAERAEKMYKKHIEVFPTHISVRIQYAAFLKRRKNDLAGAEQCFRDGLAAKPNHPECLARFAVFLHGALGKYDEAESVYSKAVKADPNNATCLSNFGLFCAEVRRDPLRARQMYENALAADSTHANALYNYGVLLDTTESHGDQEKALEMYRRATESAPAHAFAWHNLAVLLSSKTDENDVEKAKDAFRRALRINPNDAKTAEDFGTFLAFKWGEYEAGAQWLEKAASLDPENGGVWNKLGNLHKSPRGKVDYQKAKICYEKACDADPFHADAYGSLGTLYSDVDANIPAAEGAYRKAIELNPRHPENLINMADFLADVLSEELSAHDARKPADVLREAHDMYEMALQVAPSSVYVHQNYGGFLIRAAQDNLDVGIPNISAKSLYLRAEELFASALSIAPNDPVCLTNMAVIMWRQRRDYDAAQTMFEAALAASPGHPTAAAHYSAFKRDVGR